MGKIIDVNKRLSEIGGYKREEFIGKNIKTLTGIMTEQSKATINNKFLKRMAGSNVPPYEVELYKKKGELLIFEVSAKPLKKAGKLIGDLVILRDVTERKQLEEALKASEENFRNILDNSGMGIRIRDADDNIWYANPAFLNIFGYDNIEESKISPPQTHYSAEEYHEYLQRKEKSSHGEPIAEKLEVDIVRKDGTRRHVQIFGKEVLRDGKRQFQTFYNDITERKQVEDALKASEQNFRNSMDSSFIGIYIVDAEQHIHYVNSAFLDMFGYENIEEVRKSPPSEHYTPESYADYLHRKEQFAGGESIQDMLELNIVRKDGTTRHLQVFRRELIWDGKQQHQILFSDVTERKQIEDALKASEQNFRNSIASSSMGIRIGNVGEQTFYVNQAFLDIFGYESINEVSTSPPSEHYTPESYADSVLRKEKLERGETIPDQIEVDIIRKDGTIRHLQISRRDIFWNGKQESQILYNDITERKQIEKALKASEQNFRNSIDNSLMGIRITDRDDHTLYANQAFLDIFQYKNIDEIKAFSSLDSYTPEEYARYLQRKEKRERGEPTPDAFEIDITRKDNTIRHLQIFRSEIFWDGQTRYQNFYNDITKRKQIEDALKASEQNYRNTLDSSSMGIRIVDADFHVLYANQAFLDIFGYKNIDEAKASPPREHYTPASYADYLVRHERILRGESIPDELEIDIIHKDGTIRHLQTYYKKVFWDGKMQYQTLYNNITERKQMEEALKASEQNFRNSMDTSSMGIRIINTEGHILYSNQAFLDIFGYKNIDEMRKIPLQERLTSGGYTDYLLKKERALHGDPIPDKLEIDIIRKDGTIRHVQVFRKEILWDGKLQYQALYNDITKRKQMEEALKTSEQNFRNSLDTSPMGIYIVDAEFNTSYANQVFLDIFGYNNIDEVKKVPPHDYFTPESHAYFLLRREQESRGEPTLDKYEADIMRKDGTIRHLQVSRKEIYWNNKHQSQVIYNDITQRVQAEKQLEQVAQEWRTTFDSITDLISIHDKDNRILRVNKAVADLLKTTPQALIGQFCHEIMHGTKEPPAYCPNRLTLKTGKPAAIENYNPNFEAYFHESTSPIFNDKGEITGSVNVARDITQQKRIEEQLIMTDRLASIGELSSGVAHELNNPLTSVIGFSQLLMEGDAPDNIKEDLAIIYTEAQRAAVIVKNLLTFARKHAPVKQLSQVNMVIEDVLRLRAYEQKVNNIEVEYRLDTNLPEIMMDHFQMQQVFLNIIVNAESAMLEAHHKGKLIIATAKSDNIVKITFTDDGPGITKENLKRIFDPFFTTKEVGKGTGLGLSICHGIVTEHSGKIYARSENGHGAIFVVELPLNGQ